MNVLVLPVSGGSFVTQCAAMQDLCCSIFKEERPDVVLASSGGNVTIYLTMAGDWKWQKIPLVSEDMKKDFFAKPWSKIPLFNRIYGYFNGQFYNQGCGVENFFCDYFNEKRKIDSCEIWTGTYNIDQQKSRLFCNRTKEDSVFLNEDFDVELMQSMKPVYANGDVSLISKYSVASASIPAVVPPQIIDGEHYVDGGIFASSPMTVMSEVLMRKVHRENKNLHIIYINCLNLAEDDDCVIKNLIDSSKKALRAMVRCQIVNDRLTAYHCIKRFSGNFYSYEFPSTFENLQKIEIEKKKANASLLEVYPIKEVSIDITDFTGKDVSKMIESLKGTIRCRFWCVSEVPIVFESEEFEQIHPLSEK